MRVVIYLVSSLHPHFVLHSSSSPRPALFILNSSCTGRKSILSASRVDFLVPHDRMATRQHRTFSTVGTSAWNSLTSELRSFPRNLSSSFCKLLETFIFARAWAGSATE